MIVANPYGSWVEGAHAGINDALAIRHGADQSAMANYGLAHAQQFDPYELEGLKAKTRMENLNADIAQRYGDPMAAAKLGEAQFAVPHQAASMGFLGPFFKQLAQQYGINYSPEGAAETTLPGPNGTSTQHLDRMGNVMSPQFAGVAARAGRYEDLDEEAQQRLYLQWLKATGGLNSGANAPTTYLKGLTPPQVPNQFKNVQSGSSTAPTNYGLNIHSDVQNQGNLHPQYVGMGKNNLNNKMP